MKNWSKEVKFTVGFLVLGLFVIIFIVVRNHMKQIAPTASKSGTGSTGSTGGTGSGSTGSGSGTPPPPSSNIGKKAFSKYGGNLYRLSDSSVYRVLQKGEFAFIVSHETAGGADDGFVWTVKQALTFQ